MTGQCAQIFCARITPTPSEGKNVLGDSPTQCARFIQPVLGNVDGTKGVSIGPISSRSSLKGP